MRDVEQLKRLPPALALTADFDLLRDVGIEFAHKVGWITCVGRCMDLTAILQLQKADNEVHWKHHPDLTHGFLRFGPWRQGRLFGTKEMGHLLASSCMALK
jgi:acetyl esterase/lipase